MSAAIDLDRQPHTYYSPERKAQVLAILEANDGNQLKTSEETGVQRSTIQYWIANEERYAQLRQQKLASLDSRLEQTVDKYLDSIHNQDLTDVPLNHKATTFGIVFDKLQLVRNQPTSITESIERQEVTIILTEALAEVIDVTPEK